MADRIADYLRKRPSAQRVTWVHLSDLHSSADSDNFEQGKALNELPGDIANVIRTHNLTVDAIFFTGDASDAKTHAPDFADKFLPATRLISHVKKAAGIRSSSRIFCVPGNHDVERSRFTDRWQRSWSLLRRDIHELTIARKNANGKSEKRRLGRQLTKLKKEEHLLSDLEAIPKP